MTHELSKYCLKYATEKKENENKFNRLTRLTMITNIN